MAVALMAVTLAAAGVAGVMLSRVDAPRPAGSLASGRAAGRALAGHPHARTARTPSHRGAPPAAAPAAPPVASTAPTPPTSSPSPSSGTPGAGSPPPSAPPAASRRQVLSLLARYFTVINAHDYAGYLALLSPEERQGWSAGLFASGFRSTTDSAETLTGISTAADGRTVAAVTFTSHQDPAASTTHSACTQWHIQLFLDQNGAGYLIGEPPSGYTSSSAPCL